MKKCLKYLYLGLLVIALAAVLGACRSDDPAPITPDTNEEAPPADTDPAPADDDEEAPPAVSGMEPSEIQIALIAHSPDSILDDHSFNQGAWAGIQRFLSTHGLPDGNARFFQPHVADDVARIDMIADAIGGGANILVLPGFHFESSLYEAQDMFPDTKFILLDASPTRIEEVDGERIFHVRIEPNVAAIHYAEEQSGFLAGYAAVMEGHRSLGFMGGIAVPAVVRFGHGFVQGAEHAAAALGLEPGEVTINYHYLGQFAPDPAFATMAASWFHGGTEVIFAAAGGAGGSVMSGAESAGGLTIGVDVDQWHLSETVITSAIKALDVSVYDMLTDFMNNRFRSGAIRFDATNDGVGLAMGSARFENFTQAQHDAIFAQLASGAVTVNPIVTPTFGDANLELNYVVVNEIG